MIPQTGVPDYIARWLGELPAPAFGEVVPDPRRAAVFSSDMIAGFASTGSLASERVAGIVPAVTEVFQGAYRQGVRRFVLLQDAHEPNAPEFDAYPVHCVRGTPEAATISELGALPFAEYLTVVEKNSLHPALGTGFDRWLEANRDVTAGVVVGNCTDLCVYQLAMHLRLRANAMGLRDYRVVVPANAVDTYDMAEDAARQVGGYAHRGDFFHQVFLYHMALNGIQVVREFAWK